MTQDLLAQWESVLTAAIPPVLDVTNWEWGFTPSTIGEKKGVVEAFQETPHGPWWHRVTPEVLEMLRDNIRRVPVKSE